MLSMDFLEAIALGIIQGITEWLPVSSSGHLVFAQELFGLPAGENLLFDLMVHLGTVLAVCVYFRNELWRIMSALFSGEGRPEQERQLRWLGLMIIVGTVPIAVVGIVASDSMEGVFDLRLVGIALVANAAVLFAAERISRGRRRDVRLVDAVIIGAFQAVAIIPGISRSGLTICGGIFRGLQREMAATFAFLLSVPALLGAFVYGVVELERYDADPVMLGAGAVVAFAVGMVSIDYLLKAVRGGKLWVFGVYCVIVGLAAVALTL
jgi:undecaprenyl-diphosphatase